MKKNNKRRIGFTIVELVIVIGVIGILAAILIPTFVNLNGKAKEASNKSFVSEINTQLAINDALEDGNSEKHVLNNLHDVKKFLADERGFDITKITPSDGTELIWDQKADKFALVYSNGEVAFADFELTPLAHEKWIVAKDGSKFAPSARIRRGLSTKDADPFDGYSVYLADNNYDGNISVSAGFDAGDNNKIGKVTYNTNDDKDVIIRTASAITNVEVTSPNGSVDFYGAGSLEYKDAENIYLNYVKIPFLEVTKGRIVIGSNAEVEQIHLVSEDGVTFNDITIAIESGAELPEVISRDVVIIDPAGTLVVAIQDGNISEDAETQYVWLYQQGVMEQIVVTDTETFDNSQKASDYADTSNVYKVADFIANGYNGNYDSDKDSEGNVDTSNVVESGLDSVTKDNLKQDLIDKAVQEEIINNSNCPHNWELLDGRHCVNTVTGEIEYIETSECSICHESKNDKSHHDVIGTYCNTCGHPVAFVDVIPDYTTADPNPDNKMNIATSLESIFSTNENNNLFRLYLDVAYSFKAFPNMSDRSLDSTTQYKLVEDNNHFTFVKKTDLDIEGTFKTEQDIFNIFSEWYCDYYVSFDAAVKPYSCGLGGAYGDWGAIGFLAPDLLNGNPIPGNYEVPLLGMMTNSGQSNFTYQQIINLVGEFKCGFFNLSEENVNNSFTVKLRMINPHNGGAYDEMFPDYIDVGVTKYRIKSPSEDNMNIVRGFLNNNPQYAELFN